MGLNRDRGERRIALPQSKVDQVFERVRAMLDSGWARWREDIRSARDQALQATPGVEPVSMRDRTRREVVGYLLENRLVSASNARRLATMDEDDARALADDLATIAACARVSSAIDGERRVGRDGRG